MNPLPFTPGPAKLPAPTSPLMKTHPRIPLRAVVSCLGVVLASTAAASPFADSATGVGTVLGNTMSAGTTKARPQDPAWEKAKHTPTGQMYQLPFTMPKAEDIQKLASGWEYSGQVEVGFVGGDVDERNAQFRMYQDPDNGAYLNNFSLQMKKPEGGYFVELTGGGAGRHDQYYGLQFGRYNAWKVKLYFSETPHVFTDRYRTLWNGVGTGNLTLLPGLTLGGTASTAADNASVVSVLANTPYSTLSLVRKRSGVRLEADLSKTWKGYVSYALEKRQGARPFGAVWGNNPGNTPMEVAEPVDYSTHDILAGVSHVSGQNALNVRVSASIFQNHISTLTFEEPYRIANVAGVTTVPAAGAFTQGRMDLAPSNQAYNARAEYTRAMPDFYRSYFTAVVSVGRWRQDDSLIPYTSIPGITLANVTLLPGGGWDTTGSLSRSTTGASVDTRLLDLTYAINPSSDLNLKAKARYYETDNNTDPFLAVNPNAVYTDADATTAGNQTRGLTYEGLTGVWGRLLNDGSGQSILLGGNATPAGNVAIRSTPFGNKQFKFGPSADYRLNKISTANLSVDREINARENRERDRTWEDRAKIGYVNRGLKNSSLRVSYEYGQRRGSDYNSTFYDENFSSALFPIPTTTGTNVTSWAVRSNSGMRAIDLADRDQHVVNVRLDTMVRTNLDAGISLQGREAEYPNTTYGLTGHSQRSANLDLNYQPSPKQTIYAFYSYQLGRLRQHAISSQGGAAVTIGAVTPLGTITPANAVEIGQAPGGPLFPLLNAWTVRSTDRNHLTGFGLKQELGKGAMLNVDYTYSLGRTRIGYTYNVGGAINAANAVFAGDRMPDLATDVGYLDASLSIPLTARITTRLFYRYQKESIRDWHYRNLAATPIVPGANAAALPNVLMLDAGPYDYRVNWYGVMVQLKL